MRDREGEEQKVRGIEREGRAESNREEQRRTCDCCRSRIAIDLLDVCGNSRRFHTRTSITNKQLLCTYSTVQCTPYVVHNTHERCCKEAIVKILMLTVTFRYNKQLVVGSSII